jgi:hypothetical protein
MYLRTADGCAARLRIAVRLSNWNLNLILCDGGQLLRKFTSCPARRVGLIRGEFSAGLRDA